jgi:hypothetical protein
MEREADLIADLRRLFTEIESIEERMALCEDVKRLEERMALFEERVDALEKTERARRERQENYELLSRVAFEKQGDR